MVTLWYRPPEILLGKKRYSGSADVWGIGCIMAEIATKMPLFTGDSEIDQLFQIYRVMGTPNPKTWPGIEELPDYKPMGPKWRKKDLAKHLQHRLDVDGVDLLESTLIYAPNRRITAKQMLLHQWFDEIREEMKALFGGGFPHCGSPEYQRQRIRNSNNLSKTEDDSKEIDNECDGDEDYTETERANDHDDEDDVDDDDDIDIVQDTKRSRKQPRRQAMDQDD